MPTKPIRKREGAVKMVSFILFFIDLVSEGETALRIIVGMVNIIHVPILFCEESFYFISHRMSNNPINYKTKGVHLA